jgi:tetratricopeptide (TPR) repeat protein
LEALAYALSQLDRREEALDTYFELAKICHQDPDKRSLELMAEKNVAILLWMMGRKEEARELCRLLVQDYTDLYGADDNETTSVADIYRRMGGK